MGIYTVLDVNSPLPNESLNPGDLESSYTSTYLGRVFSVVSAFHNFPNVLGFFSGNEVMNDREFPLPTRTSAKSVQAGDGKEVPQYIRLVIGRAATEIFLLSGTEPSLGISIITFPRILHD